MDGLQLQFESDADESEDDLKPTNFNQAVTWATDWTTETIVLQLQRGVIDLNPNFQRRDAWRQARKSRFIESLILGLPIPQIVLAERPEKRGTYLVIDGKQRLLTLKQFCGVDDLAVGESERFILSNLPVEKKLNGKSYKDLLNEPQLNEKLSAFRSQTIRTVVIKNWPNEDFLYTVFLRLNSNSVPLSPQELRKALHPGLFINFVEQASANSKALQHALGLTNPDFRMRDVEIAIRYFAFRRNICNYRGNLKEFLDNICKDLNKRWNIEQATIRSQFEEFENAIKLTESVFGKAKSFRKYADGKYETRLNRAVFDICLYYFSLKKYAEKVDAKKAKIKEAFERLCTEDLEFLRSLETSTKTTDVVKKRFEAWGRCLSQVLAVPFVSPFR